MKTLKILGYALLGIVGLLVLFYLVLLAINWKDQPPSAAAVRFDEIIAARPQVPPAENGAVALVMLTSVIPRSASTRRSSSCSKTACRLRRGCGWRPLAARR